MLRVLAWLALTAFTPALHAQPGALDPAFGAGGVAVSPIVIGSIARALVLQPDGKLVLAGHAGDFSDLNGVLVRYLPDGTLDTDFGTSGIAFSGFPVNDVVTDAALNPDGKLVTTGYTLQAGTFNFVTHRFLADGSLDPGFGAGGRVVSAFGEDINFAEAVVVQPDGKILVGGYRTGSSADFALIRYLPDGNPDPDFGVDGTVTTTFGFADTPHDHLFELVLLPDGRFYAVGRLFGSPIAKVAVARYRADGSLDTDWGTSGFGLATVHVGSLIDAGLAAAVQPDGRVVVTGFSQDSFGSNFLLLRFETDGVLDTLFGDDGVVMTSVGAMGDRGNAVIVDPDGGILVAGYAAGVDSVDDFILIRYASDGALDESFGIGGIVRTDLPGDLARAEDAVMQPDGKVVLGGWLTDTSDRRFATARFLTGLELGLLGPGDAEAGLTVYPVPLRGRAILDYVLGDADRITVALRAVDGRLARTLLTDAARAPGSHREELRLDTDLPDGAYLLEIRGEAFRRTVRVLVAGER